MPRFFFHIIPGPKASIENEGLDLPDTHAAWIEATAACGEILRDLNGALRPGSVWRMMVRDENGTDIFELEFRTRAFDGTDLDE